jgi:hypothetical protein
MRQEPQLGHSAPASARFRKAGYSCIRLRRLPFVACNSDIKVLGERRNLPGRMRCIQRATRAEHICCPSTPKLIFAQLAQQFSGTSLGFVTTVLPPTLGFGFIDEFVLQQFEYFMIADLQFTFELP